MDEARVRDFFAALAEGRFTDLDSALDETVVLEFPGARFGGRFEGRRRVLVFLKQNQRLFAAGLRFELHWVGVMGDRAVAQWTNSGTTRTGTPYSNRGVTVFTIRDARIVRIEDYLDTAALASTWPRTDGTTFSARSEGGDP
jgi:ketosteroid isomerase-like protein